MEEVQEQRGRTETEKRRRGESREEKREINT